MVKHKNNIGRLTVTATASKATWHRYCTNIIYNVTGIVVKNIFTLNCRGGTHMISFQLNDEQKAVQILARMFAKNEIIPAAAEYDQKEEVPWHIIEKAHETGLMNLSVPEQYNGQGLDAVTGCLINEELAYGCLGINGSLVGSELAITPILLAGTEEQKKRYLPDFCSKPQLAAFCLTEPEAGSDASNVQTSAVRERDKYILNGSKCFITNAGIATLYVIFATVDRNKGIKGLTAFIVDGDSPGLGCGKIEKKLGDRASQIAEVILENVEVPVDNMLGNEGDGFKIAMMTLDRTRAGIGATAIGVAQRAFDEAKKHANERIQFGKPISYNQAIQFMFADIAMKIEAARLLVWKAAHLIDIGAEDKITTASAMAKCFAADVAMEVTVDAVQIMGGSGYMKDYPVEKLMRDAKILQIYEGTNQIQRMVIARNLLR